MSWTIANFLLANGAILLGAVVQSITGLGAGLLAVPLLALIYLGLVPAPLIFASLSLSLIMMLRGRPHIDYTYLRPLLWGLLLGTVIAAYFIASLPKAELGIAFGLLILVAVMVSAFIRQVILVKSWMYCMAGFLSGFMGASVGIGAPILALIYQHKQGATLRATLAVLYFTSSIMALVCLHLVGKFGVVELQLGIFLIPGFLLGYLISTKLLRFTDDGHIRMLVLIIATISALILIGKNL